MNVRKSRSILYVFLTMLIASIVGACATTTTGTVAKKGLEYDQYAAQWVLNGGLLNAGNFWDSVLTSIHTAAWMRGTFDRAGRNQEIQLYVWFMGQGAGQLVAVSASDSTGTSLQTHRVESTSVHTLAGQTYYAPKEVVAIDLPRRFLDERRADGLDIRLKGYNNAAPVVKVPADYLSDYLNQFDAAVAGHKSDRR